MNTGLNKSKIPRRDFLKATPVAAGMVLGAAKTFAHPGESLGGGAATTAAPSASPLRIETFDYHGVTLRESRWLKQVQMARNYYVNVSNDDILCGFRAAAGLAAPGKPLGGWCAKDSQIVFGQWLSGMARLSRATGDGALHDKAGTLMTEWAKTVKPDGDCGMPHYAWDKLVCGLVDMSLYAGNQDAVPLLEQSTNWAIKNLRHDPMIVLPKDNKIYYGDPPEWYTLAENQFRAYQLTGNPKFKDFAQRWLYHEYWNKFATTASPSDVKGVHAYSHVNTLSSAAMTYAVLGDQTYLQIIKNAYDFLQNTQCYATGGFGPNERFMAADGSLGKALETRADTFETMCGSRAAFKLA
ncbi:MAG TPA: beta-L-arabinofuranosidase domain-containing protein, partial [Terriglobia bacterium]|nr:beta-L-arabinofuranosidase domain-containing protein [Terriglobia bacterium]